MSCANNLYVIQFLMISQRTTKTTTPAHQTKKTLTRTITKTWILKKTKWMT